MSSSPRVWVLLGKGAGGNGQTLSLAEALGWPTDVLHIAHNPLQAIPNLLLGASRASMAAWRSDRLAPPWPDLVIAAGRRSAPVARWIQKRSGGQTRLVHLLHAQAPLHHFDLVVTMPQYRLPDLPNVVCVTGALNRVDPKRLAAAGRRWRDRLEHLPRPWTGLLVGGGSSSYVFDVRTARKLAREASAAARAESGSLLVSTTSRTPARSAEALFTALSVPHLEYRWKPDDMENPYLAILSLADRFIVTVDSASLPVEACATGKPVQIFEWPRRGGSARLAPLVGWRRRLVQLGLTKPPRDFDAAHRILRERGLISDVGAEPDALQHDLDRVVARVRDLMGVPTRNGSA